jgi:hypothetical protein
MLKLLVDGSMASTETEFADTNRGLETGKQAQMWFAKAVPRKTQTPQMPLSTLSCVPSR